MFRHARKSQQRPINVFSILFAGALMCAGLAGTRTPALADSFSHIPTVDLYPTVNYATGNDEYGSPGGPDPTNNYGPPVGNITSPSAGNAAGGTRPGKFDVNAVISVPIVHGLSFQYEHDRAAGIDTTIGRVTGSSRINGLNVPNNQYIYPATSNDIVDTFRLSYTGVKNIGLTVGSFYRFRHDNQGTTDPANLSPADWHEQFVTLNFSLPAIAALHGLALGASVTGEYNKHHVSGNPNISPFDPSNAGSGLAGAAAAGYSDQDGKKRYGVNYNFNGNLPINSGFSLFGSTAYGAFDFFDNSPVPFYYVIDDVGINKKFNKTLSLSADLNNLTQLNRGNVPFVYPNTIHRIYFAIAADIHLAP